MADPTGHLAGKMKWLVARYPKPPGTMIKLGSILKDPEDPETSLNLESAEGIQPVPNKRDESVAVRARISSELSTNLNALLDVKIPGNPFIDAAAKIHADKSKSVGTVVHALNVRAEIFLPTKDYMDKTLANPDVTNYVKEGLVPFSKRVYVIMGVATAENLNIKEQLEKGSSGGASAGASTAGDATKANADLSDGQHGKMDIERQFDVDCDFAYRAREFIYSKLTGKWTVGEDVTEGTMYREGEEQKKKEYLEEEVPEFDELMDEDEAPEGMYVLTI